MSLIGRRGIGPNQPPSGGSNYPFVRPSANVYQLLGDFWLSYDDPTCAFTRPLSIAWLAGFDQLNDCGVLRDSADEPIVTDAGMEIWVACPPAADENPAPGGGQDSDTPIPGYPTPNPDHTFDILVVDALGAVVFDSTQATTYLETDWSDYLKIIEWRSSAACCRVTAFTAWSPQQTPVIFPPFLVPGNAVLDPTTSERRPAGVRGIRLGLEVFTGNVVFQTGYNIALAGTQTERIDGQPYVDEIALDAVPGAGTGRAPGCQETVPQVLRINQIEADAGGNFVIQFGSCIREQAAVTLEAGGDDFNNASLGLDGLSAEDAASAIVLFDDCQPCRTCEDYVRVYKGLSRQWDQWAALAASAEGSRDAYTALANAANAQTAAVQANPVTLVASPESGTKAFVGASLCNTTPMCEGPVTMTFQLTRYVSGAPSPGGVSVQTASLDDGSGQAGNYSPSVSGDVTATFTADSLPPSCSIVARMRVCVTVPTDPATGKSLPTTLQVTLTTTVPGSASPIPMQQAAVPMSGSGNSYPCGC